MKSFRRRIVIAGVVGALVVGIGAQPVAAIHKGATIDCGTAGTFEIKTGDNGSALFKPGFFQVDLLSIDDKVVGTIVPFQISVNGVWVELVGHAAAALSHAVGLSTCTFIGSNGDTFVLVGVLNVR